MKIKVNKYILNNPKVKKDLTILNLSDIHSNIKALDKIISYIQNIKLDYILIPGDIVDILNLSNEKEFVDKVIELAKYAPTYITLGNHDKYIAKRKMGSIDEVKETYFYKKLSNTENLTLFTANYSHAELEDITISSFIFDNSYYQNREKIEEFNSFIKKIDHNNLDNNKFNILLVHSPNDIIQNNHIINYSNVINKTNLILCGHNHGGLTPTWIQDAINNHIGLFGPYTVLIQKNAYGNWSDDNKNLLVSNGVTKLAPSASFKLLHGIANSILKPEIDIIYLKNNQVNSFKLIERSKYE